MLPFFIPSSDVFFLSQHRVFAHYFYPFPLSIDNQPAVADYYNTQYLTVEGENGKHAAYGGYLRARPLPTTPGTGSNFAQANMQLEVRLAIARGITGFTFDILSLTDALSPTGHLQMMLSAAQVVDPRFWIVPMLDMSALTGLTQAQAISLIGSLNSQPSIARIPDGRMLISAFNAAQPLSFWSGIIEQLNILNVNVAFIPVLLGNPTTSPLASISIGTGGWGTAIPSVETSPASYMNPVLPQQFRPKDQLFWEASNSTAYRNGWMSSINSGAQYVQQVTWSDFSEGGQIQPYTDATLALNIGTGFYDMGAYYAAWFATGTAPVITNDVLYWFYRRMSSKAAHPNQPDNFTVIGPAEESNIELVAFLTEPGTLIINGVGFAAPAGITSFKQPTTPGFPQFALQRNGSNVFESTGPVQIYGTSASPSGTLDLTYWSGSISRLGLK